MLTEEHGRKISDRHGAERGESGPKRSVDGERSVSRFISSVREVKEVRDYISNKQL